MNSAVEWNLLLCHGNKYYKIKDMDPNLTFTVDNMKSNKPDIVCDVFRSRITRECRLFHRIAIMFCPMGIAHRRRSFFGLIDNIISKCIVVGGLFYTPDYFNLPSVDDSQSSRNEQNVTATTLIADMFKRGFVYKSDAPILRYGSGRQKGDQLHFIVFQYRGLN